LFCQSCHLQKQENISLDFGKRLIFLVLLSLTIQACLLSQKHPCLCCYFLGNRQAFVQPCSRHLQNQVLQQVFAPRSRKFPFLVCHLCLMFPFFHLKE